MALRTRTAAVFAAVAAFALVISACSPAGSADNPAPTANSSQPGTADQSSAPTDQSPAPAESGSSTTAPSEVPANEAPTGNFVVARTGDIDKLDPQLSTAFQTVQTLNLVYEGLVRTDHDGKLVGALATEWNVSADGKTITFKLRDGVKWQDGDSFSSADVKASLERILDEKTGAVGRSNLALITSVDAPDDLTVVLHLSQSNAAILYALTSTSSSILNAKDIKADTIGTKPDGTGPFMWKQWDQGQQVILAANPNYWGPPAKVATLEFRVIPSESSILSGMQANAFQMGILSDPSVAHQADGATGFKLVKQPTMSYHVLMLNGRHTPLDNIKVRQAIACAVDRQQVIDTAAFGDGEVTGPITSPAYQYSPTDGLPCTPGDINAAKKLIAESGVATPIKLNTIVETGEYATSVSEGQNLQSQLKAIGVDLELKQLSTKPYVQAWLDADFDAAVALNGGNLDPFLMYGRYYTTDGSLKGPAGLTDPALNDLLVKGNSTDDETVRHDTYQQLQQELLKTSPWVWTFRGDNYYLVSDSVSGFTPRADELLTSLVLTSAK